jgi:hypothetical protein
MSHLTDRTLESLITGSAVPADVQRIRRHVEGCRACARRLEEWRDNFDEVDERYPELAMEVGPVATVTTDGLIMLPSSEPGGRRFEIDLTTALWVGAVVMALLVGYGTYRLRSTREVVDATTLYPQLATEPESHRAGALPAIPPASARDTLARRSGTPARQAAFPVSPEFRTASSREGAQKLEGPVRTIKGLELDHMEIGPASAVPGALPKAPVVRVVYPAPDGSRMLLDQQRIPADSNGFRPVDDPGLENGHVNYGTSPTGLSVATWVDDEGYRLSLAMQGSIDDLRRMVKQVH